MIAITCTLIICGTVMLCTKMVCEFWKPLPPLPQLSSITQEELDKAYKDFENEKIPDFQDVLEAINKEIAGLTEDEDEG